MKLNTKRFFELAKENDLTASDLIIEECRSLSLTVFRNVIDNYSENYDYSVSARGILNNKFGSCHVEYVDKNTPDFLINNIIETAKINEAENDAIIFKGSKKYHRASYYHEDFLNVPISKKKEMLFRIEKKCQEYDKKVNEVNVSYFEDKGQFRLCNSYGLNLKNKFASFSIILEVVVKNGDETRVNFQTFDSDQFSEFNEDKFIKEVCEGALKQLGSKQCKSKKYPVVLNQESAAVLLKTYLANCDAEEVQKKTSLFVNKLHKQVTSKKLNVIENPLEKNIYCVAFDHEGVATSKKQIIKNGQLETLIYTLATAKKDGVEPTGNGVRSAGKAHAGFGFMIVKPGKKSEQEMISDIKEGVYIESLEGLHAGLNAQSGNFSLQCSGYMIRDGKIAEPLSLITLAGNLVEMFNDIKALSNNVKTLSNIKMSIPSIRFGKMAVSGQ